jgi:pilus assembly protein CpaC
MPVALRLAVNKTLILDEPRGIKRISIANTDIAEAAAASTHEILLNGKAPGSTTMLVWDPAGERQTYDVHVGPNTEKIDIGREELTTEVGADVSLTVEDGNVFLRGTVQDVVFADRAQAIAATLGKVVNLLRVAVPESQPQILLKVRFADIDRSTDLQLGLNLMSFNPKGLSYSSTNEYGQPPIFNLGNQSSTITFQSLLNLFYFNPQLDIGAVMQALQAKNILQILAEPNLLTVSGRPASFLAGGEFPFPTLQGGAAGVGQITIQFKEFGVRINFLPTITPRGTIHLEVKPEVSSLDYSNGLTFNGFTIPGLSTRRVQTEVELQSGQSFVIAGLLDNQITEQLNKMPGIGNIPVLGKLFQSKSVTKSNSELLVVVTPELVRPIPAGVKPPEVKFTVPFLQGTAAHAPQTPGSDVTGPVPPLPSAAAVPVEQMKEAAASTAGNNTNPPSPLGITPGLILQPMLAPPGNQPNGTPNNP